MTTMSLHARAARMTALAAVGALLLTGCGSRLSEDQIEVYAGAGGAGGAGGGVAAPGTTTHVRSTDASTSAGKAGPSASVHSPERSSL